MNIEAINKEIELIEKDARERNIPIIQYDSLIELKEIVRTLNPKRILEIGTAIGYSAINMSLVSNAKIISIEKDFDRYKESLENINKFGLDDKITVINGDAHDILSKLPDNQIFDFIFMDGPKSHYLEYLLMIEKHIDLGSIVVADDILYFGYVKSLEPIPRKHRTIVNNLRKYINYVVGSGIYKSTIKDIGHGLIVSECIKKR